MKAMIQKIRKAALESKTDLEIFEACSKYEEQLYAKETLAARNRALGL